MKILFCNVGWMRDYNGIVGDSIQRGGSYNDDSTGHEVCNFSVIRNRVYGYVQPTGQIKIEKLGASKNDDSVSGVTVVWTAGPDSGGTAVVGWYKDATVYRDAQLISNPTKLQKENELKTFRISAPAERATLLRVEERDLLIPRAVKGGIGQSNVWYADKPESNIHIEGVLRLINGQANGALPDVDLDNTAHEGNPRLVAHLRRERNSKIVKAKKQKVLKETGSLCCEVCEFDFAMVYGRYGLKFCEVHHLKQLSEADGIVQTELKDLAIVCSNCHRIIHRKNPMHTISALKKIINKKRT